MNEIVLHCDPWQVGQGFRAEFSRLLAVKAAAGGPTAPPSLMSN